MIILSEMVYTAERVLFYNAPFDLRVLRKYSFDDMKINQFDVMALVWNVDTNWKMPSLKDTSVHFLGFKYLKFKDLLKQINNDPNNFKLTSPDEEEDFKSIAFLTPEQVVSYAASDAICTYFLFLRFHRFYQENKFIVDLDSNFERVFMHLEETPIALDVELYQQMYEQKTKEIEASKNKFFDIVGRENIKKMFGSEENFNMNSNDDLGKVLYEILHIPVEKKITGTKTKKVRYILNEDVLTPLTKEYPILKDLIEYRGLMHDRGTYLQPFIDNNKPHGFFHYFTHQNPTGRLQGVGEKPKAGETPVFLRMQPQNILKPEAAFFTGEFVYGKYTPNERPQEILGWNFKPATKEQLDVLKERNKKGQETKDLKIVEGYKLPNLRQIIKPHPGHIVLSIDYSGQEIVVCANLSGDKAFLEPLMQGIDPHKYVAEMMFGKENYTKDLRKIAKQCNFGCIYLGTEYALQKSIPDKTLEELKEYVQKWRIAHKEYFDYLRQLFFIAKKNGYVKSPLGRHRRVATWFNSPDWKEVHFGEKTVANSPVQGTGGDIIRLILIRIYLEVIRNPKYIGHVHFMSTVHDEVNYSIDPDPEYFYEIAGKIIEITEDLPFNYPPFNWRVPLKAGISLGPSWGELYPFKIKDGLWLPKWE
jgi:DNA polymerase I-like protein with 3'-5' exonuclease and polymerase domains